MNHKYYLDKELQLRTAQRQPHCNTPQRHYLPDFDGQFPHTQYVFCIPVVHWTMGYIQDFCQTVGTQAVVPATGYILFPVGVVLDIGCNKGIDTNLRLWTVHLQLPQYAEQTAFGKHCRCGSLHLFANAFQILRVDGGVAWTCRSALDKAQTKMGVCKIHTDARCNILHSLAIEIHHAD
mgnify:CR=1 FL=1